MEMTINQEIMYEELKESGRIAPKIDFLCEHVDADSCPCAKPADTEWKKREATVDGLESYSTFRCDEHQLDDLDYEPIPC